MAQSIDIEFYPDATAKCSNCGSVYTIASSQKEITVEICGNCHPFYTGQDVVVDTAGRIEKFQARLAKTEKLSSSTTSKTKKKKVRIVRQTLQDLLDDQTKTPNEIKSESAEKQN
jgi:large subunit ribosomal protein L31